MTTIQVPNIIIILLYNMLEEKRMKRRANVTEGLDDALSLT